MQSMTIMTGGYPAEYGRKLGGVIEVVTAASAASRVWRFAVRRQPAVSPRGAEMSSSSTAARRQPSVQPPAWRPRIAIWIRRSKRTSRTTVRRGTRRCGSSTISARQAGLASSSGMATAQFPGAERARPAGRRAAPGSHQPRERAAVLGPADHFFHHGRRYSRHGARRLGEALVQSGIHADRGVSGSRVP